MLQLGFSKHTWRRIVSVELCVVESHNQQAEEGAEDRK